MELSATIWSLSPRSHKIDGLRGMSTMPLRLKYLGLVALIGPNTPGATLGQLADGVKSPGYLSAPVFSSNRESSNASSRAAWKGGL